MTRVIGLDPTAVLWPHLDLQGVGTLHWPGVKALVAVSSTRAPLAIRLARDVHKRPDGCWYWTGPTDRDGYARVKIGQRDTRLLRVVWEIEHAARLGPDEVVRHTCDQPACLRPAHLLRGTVADNNHDRADRGRTAHGERHYAAKLTAGSVRDIRRRAAAGETRKALAAEFGVSGQLVSRVVLRQIWADLPDHGGEDQ